MKDAPHKAACLILLFVVVLGTACTPAPSEGAIQLPTGEADGQTVVPQEPTPASTATPEPEDIHYAQGPGRWYPADPDRLRAAVEAYMSDAEAAPVAGPIQAVIVPHAAYIYSGAVAGYAYRALAEAGCSGMTIVLIGDTHTGHGTSQIAVWPEGAFHTPLGTLPVDEKMAQALVDSAPAIEAERRAFIEEHPIENQVPFIQIACPGARIVPVVIGQPSLQSARILAEAVVAAFAGDSGGAGGLIVASTDLSHYYPYATARRIDEVALQAISSLEPQAVVDSSRRCSELGIGSDPGTMCSQGAVMTAIIAARGLGANRATVLNYANSGDSPAGDREDVVGYGAVVLWQNNGHDDVTGFALPPVPAAPIEALPLSQGAKQELLRLARDTATRFLTTQTFPPFYSENPALLQFLGAYVAYEHDGELRGCVGRVEADRPVYLNVQYAAVAAAVLDSRFPMIAPEELDSLGLEITLLEPLVPVLGPEQIELGRDGILMRVGEEHSALFLPQVPLEEGWDLETTLSELSRKAGLADDGWQSEDVRFYVFEGEWFGD